MGLEPLLFIVGLAAIAGATLSLIFILAHGRAATITSPQAESDALRILSVPHGGRILALDRPGASPSEGWREQWAVETDLTWPVYRKGVRKRLREYACIQSAERLALIRTIPEHGVRTVTVEPETDGGGCRAHFAFAAISK